MSNQARIHRHFTIIKKSTPTLASQTKHFYYFHLLYCNIVQEIVDWSIYRKYWSEFHNVKGNQLQKLLLKSRNFLNLVFQIL